MTKFLKPSARVLNIMASGQATVKVTIDPDLSAGRVRPKSLVHSLINFVSASELVMHLIGSDPNLTSYTLVSTHPGFLHTDLHAGQGKLFEILSSVAVAAAGVSVEEAGLQQASILASPKLHPQSISYVSSDLKGRTPSDKFRASVDVHAPWLREFLHNLHADV